MRESFRHIEEEAPNITERFEISRIVKMIFEKVPVQNNSGAVQAIDEARNEEIWIWSNQERVQKLFSSIFRRQKFVIL